MKLKNTIKFFKILKSAELSNMQKYVKQLNFQLIFYKVIIKLLVLL